MNLRWVIFWFLFTFQSHCMDISEPCMGRDCATSHSRIIPYPYIFCFSSSWVNHNVINKATDSLPSMVIRLWRLGRSDCVVNNEEESIRILLSDSCPTSLCINCPHQAPSWAIGRKWMLPPRRWHSCHSYNHTASDKWHQMATIAHITGDMDL